MLTSVCFNEWHSLTFIAFCILSLSPFLLCLLFWFIFAVIFCCKRRRDSAMGARGSCVAITTSRQALAGAGAGRSQRARPPTGLHRKEGAQRE